MAGFREWAKAEGLENVGDIAQFKGTRIAIDARDYLDGILTATATREPLLPALGGMPFTLQRSVDADLQRFRESEIEPIFVFEGLDVAARDRSSVLKESLQFAETLDKAWESYDQTHGEEAVGTFGKACTYRTRHIARWLLAHLHKSGVAIQTAPYTAAAQMVYLEANGYADAVAGAGQCLAFGADKVITRFDWSAERIAWVDSREYQGKLLLTFDQFNDLLLLSGFSLLTSLPFVTEPSVVGRVAAVRSLLSRANQDGYAVCLQAKDDEYQSAFKKARAVLKHSPHVDETGVVKLNHADSTPNDVHDFVSQRLPDELYLYLARGVAGPRVLNWRTQNQVIETPPLDGGIATVYQTLVQQKLRPLREQAVALITRSLHRYYQKTDVHLVCWFDADNKQALDIPGNTLIEDRTEHPELSAWHVQPSNTANFAQTWSSSTPLVSAIDMLADDGTAKKTVTPRSGGNGLLETPDQVLANISFRFLQDRGYINNDHTLSAWGRALRASFQYAQQEGYFKAAKTGGEAEEALFVAFELLRLDLLNGKSNLPVPPYSGQPWRGSDIDKTNALLISRIASLGYLTHDTIGYTGPLSRHILAYHQMAATVRGALRDLTEMHACDLFLSGSASRSLTSGEYTTIGAEMPFLKEPDCGLGLLVKSYLDELSNEETKTSNVTKWFTHATDIAGDLQKVWKMWGAINAGVQAADSSIVNNDTRRTFKLADIWLTSKLANAPAVNGTS